VPLIDQAAAALDGLSRRGLFTGTEDRVFCSREAVADGPLRDRFYLALTAAGLGHLREKPDPIVFHDLRHTFGTLAVQTWPLVDVRGTSGTRTSRPR